MTSTLNKHAAEVVRGFPSADSEAWTNLHTRGETGGYGRFDYGLCRDLAERGDAHAEEIMERFIVERAKVRLLR